MVSLLFKNKIVITYLLLTSPREAFFQGILLGLRAKIDLTVLLKTLSINMQSISV